jgi:hypothetical protein
VLNTCKSNGDAGLALLISGERVSNTWATCPSLWDNFGKPVLIPDTTGCDITSGGKNFGEGWARGLSASW